MNDSFLKTASTLRCLRKGPVILICKSGTSAMNWTCPLRGTPSAVVQGLSLGCWKVYRLKPGAARSSPSWPPVVCTFIIQTCHKIKYSQLLSKAETFAKLVRTAVREGMVDKFKSLVYRDISYLSGRVFCENFINLIVYSDIYLFS